MGSAPKIDVTINQECLHDLVKEFLTKVFPALQKEEIDLDVFPKSVNRGLLNTMVKCTWKNDAIKPNAVIVRVKDNEMLKEFFRDLLAEADYVQILHEQNVAPRVIAIFNNGFCYEYIEGEVLSEDKIAEEPICWLIAKELAKIHSSDIDHESILKIPMLENKEIVEKFQTMFPIQLEDPERNERFKTELPPFETLLQEKEIIEKHIKDLGVKKLVLCHNDVRAENILYNKETGKLSFVDFEALNYNYAEFEIAQHFLRYCGIDPPKYSKYPSEEFQKKWIRVYLETFRENKPEYGKTVTDKDVEIYFVIIMKYKLFWLLWSVMFAPFMESKFPIDGLEFGLASWKSFQEEREKIFAMTLPE